MRFFVVEDYLTRSRSLHPLILTRFGGASHPGATELVCRLKRAMGRDLGLKKIAVDTKATRKAAVPPYVGQLVPRQQAANASHRDKYQPVE
jgi:hypothetical protein